MITHSQMIALGLNVRVDDLVVEKLSALGHAGDAPCIVIEQSPQERELSLMVENCDL